MIKEIMDERNKGKEVVDQKPPSLLGRAAPRALTHPKLMRMAGLFGILTTLGGTASSANVQANVSKETLGAFSSGKPSASQFLEEGMPSQSKELALASAVSPVDTGVETRFLDSLEFATALSNLMMTRQEVEASPQQLVESKDTVDSQGNVNKQFVLHKNGYLYESYIGGDGKFTEFATTSQEKIPVQNLNSFAVSEDGSVVVAVGEDPTFSNRLGIARSYDGGRTWQKASIRNADGTDRIINGIGTSASFIQGSGNKFLINVGGFETEPGLQILTVNSQTQQEQLLATNILGKVANSVVAAVDASAKTIQVLSDKETDATGVDIITLNYETGVGSVNHISSLIFDGQERTLGYLYGKAAYKDTQGRLRIKASDSWSQLLYDFDLLTRIGTKINYANILDDIDPAIFPNYVKSGLYFDAVAVVPDGKGGINTWLAGQRAISNKEYGGAVLVHFETRTPYDLEPNMSSTIVQKFMRLRIVSGKLNFDLIIDVLGKSGVAINLDGTPDSSNKDVFYPGRGLGSKSQTLSPRAFLPILQNRKTGGW